MPRHSAAELAVVRVDPGPRRLRPPEDLGEAEMVVWRTVVDACDPKHFERSDEPLLVEYCTAVVQARQAAAALAKEGAVLGGRANPWIVVQEKAGRAMSDLRAVCEAKGWSFKPWEVHPADVAAGRSPWPEGAAGTATWSKAQQLCRQLGHKPRRRLTRGQLNVAWLEAHCRIPEGPDVGKPVRLRRFQKRVIREIYDRPTRRVIASMGRKNAKSALAAMLLLLHLVGPEARLNSQLYSSALSREQAALIYALAVKMVRLSPVLSRHVAPRESAKVLTGRELGSVYRALSADAPTAFGINPVFLVHDELGQVRGPTSHLYEALETATGAQADPLSIIISTQAPTENDLLSILIDDAKKGGDPKVRLILYSADPDLDPFGEEAIRQANPAFGDFQNAAEVLAMAEDARRMPAREAEYRNLVLNQRVALVNPFISASVWSECGGPVIESFAGLPVYGGLDLSETADLTALVLIAPTDGRWHVRPTFWLPEEGLAERARKDRVQYDVWAQQGFLETTPGRSIEYEYIARELRRLFDRLDIRQIAFDRWNFRHLRPWLEKAGFAEAELERFVEFGQGFQSMSPALRDLESDLLAGRIVHGNHPVLMMCAANAVVERNQATGDRKLSKGRSRGRIDGMLGLAMARAVAATEEIEPPKPRMFSDRLIAKMYRHHVAA